MSRSVCRALAAAAATAAVALAGGCAGDPAPGAAVPELRTLLSQVDEAVVGQNWADARTRIQQLVARADEAQQAGTLTQEQSDRIQAAAARLLAELPRPAPRATATPAPRNTGGQEKPEEKEKEEGDADKDQEKDGEKGGGKGH